MTTLTNNEVDVLTAICAPEQAEYAKHDTGSTWTDAEELAAETGKSIRSVVGILGSLSKKGLIYCEDNGEGLDLQCISEEGCAVLETMVNRPVETETPVVEEDEDKIFDSCKQLADYLYSRKGKVFISVPTVGGALNVQAVKQQLWDELMLTPESSTHFRCMDLENGSFVLYSAAH